jgi:hypothetical protein
MKRVVQITLGLFLGLAFVTTGLAAGTPIWWDDNNTTYTTWQKKVVTGNAANNSGNSQDLLVYVDSATCSVGSTTHLWMQISWVNTGSQDVAFLMGPIPNEYLRRVLWTNDASGCPASIDDPLPSYDGNSPLNNMGDFSPTDNSVPSNFPFDNGYERSYDFPDASGTCARTTTAWTIPDGGGLEYQIEVQTVCQGPNAVTLSAIDAGPALAGWPAFALVVAMVAGGAGLFVWKRRA